MGGCIEGPRLGSEADRSLPLSDSLLVNRGPPLPPALGGCEALPFAAAAPPAAAAAPPEAAAAEATGKEGAEAFPGYSTVTVFAAESKQKEPTTT